MMHHSTDDDSELELRPDAATIPVQQSVDAASDSRPPQDPDSSSPVSNHTISITVSHDSSEHLLHVPDHATFGDVKNALVQKTELEASNMKLLFSGDEKDDAELLQAAGVSDGSNLVLVEEEPNKREEEQVEPPPVMMTEEIAKAIAAVQAVTGDIDELSDRVVALEAAVDGGTIVAVKEFDTAAEMLMRQLLKLDGIKAAGEARVQRKAEVRRVQKLQEDVDTLKARCYRAKPQL
ncbi:BAG domain-containing protein [Hirschfeldia incana]|nr:BAG domain-containing protein [Hirschfeldia incana]